MQIEQPHNMLNFAGMQVLRTSSCPTASWSLADIKASWPELLVALCLQLAALFAALGAALSVADLVIKDVSQATSAF